VDTAGAKLGVSSGTAQLELPLLAEGLPLASGSSPFMPVVTGDTYKNVNRSLA